MKKNYILSYKIFPIILAGYAFLELLVYLYFQFMVWNRESMSGPVGNYITLAIASLLTLPILVIGAHTTYLALKKNEPSENWPPLWKHIVLLTACIIVGIASLVLGIFILRHISSM